MRLPRPPDEVELAPTGESTCQLCESQINKGSPRIRLHFPHTNGKHWNTKFFCVKCIQNTQQGKALFEMANLSFNGGTNASSMSLPLLDLGIAQAYQEKEKTKAILKQRSELKDELRSLREKLVDRFGYEKDQKFKVFDNRTLDNLVLDLPCDLDGLLKIHGFKEKRVNMLGKFVLPVIRRYKRSMGSTTKEEGPAGEIEQPDKKRPKIV